MRQYVVELGGFHPWLWGVRGDLNETHQKFTQQPDHWTLFFFEHEGFMVVNNRPIPFGDGYVGFVVPGAKIEFPKVGSNCPMYQLTFGLISRRERVMIPAVSDLGDMKEARRAEFRSSELWLHTSVMRALACAYNTLWSIAQPVSSFRKSDLVYEAEAVIMRRLSESLNIAHLASELGISHTHLLRLFREEHGLTIQEYVREKRSEIARQLICGTDLPLKQIALRVGAPNLQYFNKLVRLSTGLPPSKLREQALTRTLHDPQ